jgi:hypothetical protein
MAWFSLGTLPRANWVSHTALYTHTGGMFNLLSKGVQSRRERQFKKELLLQGADGSPLAGFALEDCLPIVGDFIEHSAGWNPGGAPGAIAGRPVGLRFELADADLFAMRFR